MTDDDERERRRAAMERAKVRWYRFFVANPDRRYFVEQQTELPEPEGGYPIIRVVERTNDDDAEMTVLDHLPASRFGETALLHLYGTLLPYTQERMAKMLAKAWDADEEIGSTDEDEERLHDAAAQPWWFDRIIEAVQQTEAYQRRKPAAR